MSSVATYIAFHVSYCCQCQWQCDFHSNKIHLFHSIAKPTENIRTDLNQAQQSTAEPIVSSQYIWRRLSEKPLQWMRRNVLSSLPRFQCIADTNKAHSFHFAEKTFFGAQRCTSLVKAFAAIGCKSTHIQYTTAFICCHLLLLLLNAYYHFQLIFVECVYVKASDWVNGKSVQ